MKRRGFIASLAGLCAAPAVAMLPKAPVELLPEYGALTAFSRRMADLDRYEFAEFQAAVLRVISEAMAVPPSLLTNSEVLALYGYGVEE